MTVAVFMPGPEAWPGLARQRRGPPTPCHTERAAPGRPPGRSPAGIRASRPSAAGGRHGQNGPVQAPARAADDGFASAWLSNIFGLDALTALAVAGNQVAGIELGTAVVPTYPRHPAALAQQALTTAAACGG